MTDEQKRSLETVLNYLDEELQDYEESGSPDSHIYTDIKILEEFLESKMWIVEKEVGVRSDGTVIMSRFINEEFKNKYHARKALLRKCVEFDDHEHPFINLKEFKNGWQWQVGVDRLYGHDKGSDIFIHISEKKGL